MSPVNTTIRTSAGTRATTSEEARSTTSEEARSTTSEEARSTTSEEMRATTSEETRATTSTDTRATTSAERSTDVDVSSVLPTSNLIAYLQSCQAVLKLVKILCFSVMVVLAIWEYKYKSQNRHEKNSLLFAFAISTLGLIMEVVIFLLYLCEVHLKWSELHRCSSLILMYHESLLMLVFIANIVLNRFTCDPLSEAFNACSIVALVSLGLDTYFNILWYKKGPELLPLPCFKYRPAH